MKVTLPIPPSVNHSHANALIGGRRVRVPTAASRAWTAEAVLRLKVARSETWDEKVVCELWTYWPDRRRRDTHNLHKLLCDAIEKAGVVTDDRLLLIRDMDYEVDRDDPRVVVSMYRKDG